MSLSQAKGLLKAFSAKHQVRLEDVNKVGENDWEVLRVSRQNFEKATLIADTLSFPVTITYVSDSGENRSLSVLIREIRKFDANTFLLRIIHDANNKEELLTSDRIREIYAGEFGTRYENQGPGFKSAEEQLAKAGGKLLEMIGFTVKDWKAIAPSIERFFSLFTVFSGNLYLHLRIKLHIMVFLARLDRRYCAQEANVIRSFIQAEPQVSPADVDTLLAYVANTLITNLTFEEAISKLDVLPASELATTLRTIESLIEADGKITQEEKALFDSIVKELND